MPEQPKLAPITLATALGGAVEERFQRCLKDVLANMQDPNTDLEKTRAIVVTLAFDQTEGRAAFELSADVKSKLAPLRTVSRPAYLGRRDGKDVVVHYDPRQAELFPGATDSKVTPITTTPQEAQDA